MVGGHGTAASFGALLDSKYGVGNATTVGFAAATFGLIMGGLTGGPVAHRLIRKYRLVCRESAKEEAIDEFTEEKINSIPAPEEFFRAFSMLFLAAGFGTLISALIEKTGITFSSYIGAMIAAALLRNLSDVSGKSKNTVMIDIVGILGYVSLTLFLTLSLMGLKLWQLSSLALPMIVMLLGQTIVVVLVSYFLVFRLMGKDYEAAVIASATCGFGMGATPNAIANMEAITSKTGPAPRAFFVVPLVGSLFVDFINGLILTVFINFI